MRGMSRTTGRALDGQAHLRQSVADILSTPVGSRVMRRDYGSQLPDLVDRPLNAATRLQIFAATALALMRWEPRLQLTRVALDIAAGLLTLTIEGRDRTTDRPARFTLTRSPTAPIAGFA